ncbi:phosphatidylethanolamine-binding protein 4 isoform X2 [Oxyura jamaicensis]|uniref:phosphatidylethanolamine-binding protein 4 isoform X2 n=1 Tax=Oxyura jamaicensis TaxID=8884 RepID=UPI0015A61DF5|nr:phosphatidylethanolamine-binding protein 4 isoform X2 [Oxyura jamaicensis]
MAQTTPAHRSPPNPLHPPQERGKTLGLAKPQSYYGIQPWQKLSKGRTGGQTHGQTHGRRLPAGGRALVAVPRLSRLLAGLAQGRMELLVAVLLAASLLGTAARGAQAPWPDEPSHTCFFQTLSSPDSEFCRGDLEVTYPQLGNVGCSYIPQCHQYRWRISREWGSPRVRYPRADKGTDLRTGDLKGRVLTDYVRPTPPPRSGYHRYQLRLYEQPAGQHIALGPEELLSLGAWAMESFVERFQLGSPVASTQFLTKHHED